MPVEWAWDSDMDYMVLHSKTVTFIVLLSPQEFHMLFVFKVLTLMTNAQIKDRFFQIIGHTVRLGGRGMVYFLDAGQEINEQRKYRDLLSTSFPSFLSDIRYGN